MKAITKFKADDGAEFNAEAECIAHEALCAEIDEIMSTLPKRLEDDGCEFSNGHGFLQHSAERFWPARDALLRIGNRLFPHKWFDQSLADRTVDPGWAGRIISETSAPLHRAWQRISCVDKQLREWGQSYYANNPDKAPNQQPVCRSAGESMKHIHYERLSPGFEKWHLGDGRVLHRFTAPDLGDPHCHPWDFESHILSGYDEEVFDLVTGRATLVARPAGSTHCVKATDVHRIVRLHGPEAWTIVTAGPKVREPRFWRFGVQVQSRQWDQAEWQHHGQPAQLENA